MLVSGDHSPIVVRRLAQRARIAEGDGHAITDKLIRRAVVGLEVNVVRDAVAWVWITAGPAQVYVDSLISSSVRW